MSDAASVMFGAKSGVGKLFEDEFPWSKKGWCLTHRANLMGRSTKAEKQQLIAQVFTDKIHSMLNASHILRDTHRDLQSKYLPKGEPHRKPSKMCIIRWLSLKQPIKESC